MAGIVKDITPEFCSIVGGSYDGVGKVYNTHTLYNENTPYYGKSTWPTDSPSIGKIESISPHLVIDSDHLTGWVEDIKPTMYSILNE
jgi:hypothetical protein